MGSIFISYRRSDSAGESGRLWDDLIARFGKHAVFMDVDAIQPGRDFRKALRESVGGCTLLLAVIGPSWLEVQDSAGGRRLDNENDYVRVEIGAALKRDIPVVPVLVRGARMPKAEYLPEELRELAFRNSVELTHARWKSDVQVLAEALAPYLAECEAIPANPEPDKLPAVAAPLAGPQVDAVTMARVSHELANYIGPIAELVVKRAAKRCPTLHQFYDLAAQEIESQPDRDRFLKACRL